MGLATAAALGVPAWDKLHFAAAAESPAAAVAHTRGQYTCGRLEWQQNPDGSVRFLPIVGLISGNPDPNAVFTVITVGLEGETGGRRPIRVLTNEGSPSLRPIHETQVRIDVIDVSEVEAAARDEAIEEARQRAQTAEEEDRIITDVERQVGPLVCTDFRYFYSGE